MNEQIKLKNHFNNLFAFWLINWHFDFRYYYKTPLQNPYKTPTKPLQTLQTPFSY